MNDACFVLTFRKYPIKYDIQYTVKILQSELIFFLKERETFFFYFHGL